jgi:hypothetical protein
LRKCEREEMEESDEGTENTTVLVGWRVTLTCFACREYNNYGKKQETSVHISGERPTLFAYLKVMRKRLEKHHEGCAEAFDKKAPKVSSVHKTSS